MQNKIFEFENFHINTHFRISLANCKTIFFIHGFSGSSDDWREVIEFLPNEYDAVAIDLIGHGKSSSPSELKSYLIENLISQFNIIVKEFKKEKNAAIGYSMGGRFLLNYTLKNPTVFDAVVFESSSFGILNILEREARRAADNELADFIENHEIEEFVSRWINNPIFSSLKNLYEKKYLEYINNKLRNSKLGLANSLRGFGTGVMDCLYNQLYKINVPILLVTGESDKKFNMINDLMLNEIAQCEHVIISNSGHIPHLENLQEFVKNLNGFLNKYV